MEIHTTPNIKRTIIAGISLLMLAMIITFGWGTVSDSLQPEHTSETLKIPKLDPPKSSAMGNPSSSQQSITVKEGSNLSQIFTELGIPAKTTQEIEELGETVTPLSQLKIGSTLRLDLDPTKNYYDSNIPLLAIKH